MIIEVKTYETWALKRGAEYIHRYYLPWELRNELQVQDISALYSKIGFSRYGEVDFEDDVSSTFVSETISIYYEAERLVKKLDKKLLLPAIKACLSYHKDCLWHHSFSDEEIHSLLSLNDRLRKIEGEIYDEAERVNREMLLRKQRGELFHEDFEVESEITYYLADDDPMSRDDDDNILHQYDEPLTIRENVVPEQELLEWQKRNKDDWNDTRPFNTSPLFSVPHSWLFHDLIDHSGIPHNHLCRIGTIGVDISCKMQRWIERSDSHSSPTTPLAQNPGIPGSAQNHPGWM